jgi:uncharacterized protein DUF4333
MKRVARALTALGVVFGLALALPACSKGKQVEDKIAETIESARNIKGLKVKCPGDVSAKKGKQIDCTVTGDQLSTIGGTGTTQAALHVVFDQDDEFTITTFTPSNGPNSGTNLISTSSGAPSSPS